MTPSDLVIERAAKQVSADFREGRMDSGSLKCTIRAALEAVNYDELVKILEGIKWKSCEKDNMEFAARITCFQMDDILALLSKLKGETNE